MAPFLTHRRICRSLSKTENSLTNDLMNILMLVNWKVNFLHENSPYFQPPDKYLAGQKYWFFRQWPEEVNVDVIDYTKIIPFFYFEKNLLKFYIFQSMKALFRKKKYDLIISHGAQSGLVLAFLRRIFGSKEPPHVIIDIGCFNGGRGHRLELLPIKIASRSLQGIIYHASVQEDYYRKYIPYLKRRFIPFGVDTDFFQPIKSRPQNYIMAPGYAKRDYPTLLSAWSRINGGDTKLKIIGVDQIQYKGKITQGVEFIRRLPVHEFKTLIANSLFVVIPLPVFKYAYGQMSMLQAMAMGKAIIITRTPSTEDYLCDGENGLFVRPYDQSDLATKITLLLNDPGLIAKLESNARKIVENKFSEKAMAKNIYEFVKEIVQ